MRTVHQRRALQTAMRLNQKIGFTSERVEVNAYPFIPIVAEP